MNPLYLLYNPDLLIPQTLTQSSFWDYLDGPLCDRSSLTHPLVNNRQLITHLSRVNDPATIWNGHICRTVVAVSQYFVFFHMGRASQADVPVFFRTAKCLYRVTLI